MELPIPDDWDGKSWHCIQLRWPDSTLYNAILMGFLSYLTRGRAYNEETGSIKTAQSVGWEIWRRNAPLYPCSGDKRDTTDNYPSPGIEPCAGCYEGLDTCEGCEGEIMPCCIDELEWRFDGLYYRQCGKWYKVGGTLVDFNLLPDDGVDEPVDPSDTLNWACVKAHAVANLLFVVGQTAIEVMPADYFSWKSAIESASHIEIHDWEAFNLWKYMALLEVTQIADLTDNLTANDKATLICRLARKLDGSNNDLGQRQYEIIIDEVQAMVSITDVADWTFVSSLVEVIGLDNFRLATRTASYTETLDCNCPGETPVVPVDAAWQHIYNFKLAQYGWALVAETEGRAWELGAGYVNRGMTQNEHLPTIFKTAPNGLDGCVIKYIRMDVSSWPASANRTAIEWSKIPPVTVIFDDVNYWGSSQLSKVVSQALPGDAEWHMFNGQATSENTSGDAVLWQLVIAGDGDDPWPDDPGVNG